MVDLHNLWIYYLLVLHNSVFCLIIKVNFCEYELMDTTKVENLSRKGVRTKNDIRCSQLQCVVQLWSSLYKFEQFAH